MEAKWLIIAPHSRYIQHHLTRVTCITNTL